MKSELKPYGDYSPAESESIGEVPVGWDVLPFKRLCKRVDVGIAEAATHAYAETGVPIVRGTNIRPHRIEGEILYIEPWFAEKNRSKYMRTGDLVTVRTGYPGVTAVIPPALDKSQCFTMIISTMKKGHSPEFFCYFFNSICGMAHFAVEGWGSAQTNISVPTVQRIEVPLPTPDDQKTIVAFLDRETAKIDRLMEVRRKQVERLQEQRTAVIHHVVTKGLDPNAKMKPSGVEWLGDVNCAWMEYDIKHVAEVIAGGTPKSSEYDFWDGDVVWLTPTDLGKDNARNIEASARTITALGQAAAGLAPLPVGSLVMSTRAPVGSMGILAVPATTNQGCKGMVFDRDKADGRFFYYLLSLAVPYLNAVAQGATFVELSGYQLKNLPIACPDTETQREIANWLDQEMNSFDTLAAKYRRELELLAEYRASLISHAVTGKIDVRGLVPPVPEKSL